MLIFAALLMAQAAPVNLPSVSRRPCKAVGLSEAAKVEYAWACIRGY